jgi:uncharacterized protein
MNALTEPLTDAEFDRLDDFLRSVNPGEGMSLEELDGFFCALICSPEVIPPSEYMPHIFGGELVQGHGVSTIGEAAYISALLTRHWNTIAGTLHKGEVYVPMIFDNEDGIAMGNEWAVGFEHGIKLRRESWRKLVYDAEHWEILALVVRLGHEDDPDPEMRSEVPITPKKREEMLSLMAECTLAIYDFFRSRVPREAKRKQQRRRVRRDVQ